MRMPRKDVTDLDRFNAINDLSIAITDALSHLPVWGDWEHIKEYRNLMKDVRACWRLLKYILPKICPSQNEEFNPSSDMLAEDIMRCIQPIMSETVLDGNPYDWGHRSMWTPEENQHFIQHAAEPFRELRKALRGTLILSSVPKFQIYLNLGEIIIEREHFKLRRHRTMNRSISVGIRPTPLSEIGYVDRYTQPKPRGIQFPDGTVLQFNANWFNVLRMTAHWLAHTGRLTASNARVLHKKIRRLRVTDGENPTHPTARNRPFRSPERVAEGVYLENNWTAEDAKTGAIGLLERFDIDPDSVIIGF